jgi:hypothetical protein
VAGSSPAILISIGCCGSISMANLSLRPAGGALAGAFRLQTKDATME